MKLELGAGSRPTPGYRHQDVRELPGIDIVCDVRQLPPELRGKLTEIYGYHVLEHIPWREVQQAVNHWVEWLAPGGTLRHIAPDFLSLAQWLAAKPNDDYINDRVQYMSQGSQTYGEQSDPPGSFEPTNVHMCMTTVNTVSRWYRQAGLAIVRAQRMNNRQPWGEHCPMIEVVGQKPQ